MSELIIPDSRFEMPSLQYPNRKPVGNVKIDWGHPLAKKLQFLYLGGYVDLVSGDVGEIVNGAYPHRGDLDASMGAAGNGPNKPSIRFPTLSKGGDVTVLSISSLVGSTNTGNMRLYDNKDSYSAADGFYLGISITGHAEIRGGGGSYTIKESAIEPHKFNVLVTRYTGSQVELFENSALKHAATIGAISSVGKPITIAHDYGNTTYGYDGIIKAIAFFDTLSDAEICSLSASPYQFLITV